MGILNQSIHPNARPLFPTKAPGAHDAYQNPTTLHPFHGAQSTNSFQTNSLKTTSLNIGPKILDEPPNGLSHLLQNNFVNEKITAASIARNVEIDPFAHAFMCFFPENEKLIRIDEEITELDQYKPQIVLSVSVSSAVKLESAQIELIARKMQRLTGFRNLMMENIVDPSLIAGFVISYGDDESHIIDLSVKGQLAALAARVESSDKRISDSARSWRGA